jgi:hypothetical protein
MYKANFIYYYLINNTFNKWFDISLPLPYGIAGEQEFIFR